MFGDEYKFVGGYPTPETVERAYDDADLNRAVQAYRFFFPTTAFADGFDTFPHVGVQVNRSAAIMRGTPKQVVFTANSDTPYAMVPLDLSVGPIVLELPPGPLMGVVNDLNERWVMDIGLPGPDAGKGGRHVMIPPGYQGAIPDDLYQGSASTNLVTFLLRALPIHGDEAGAIASMQTVRIYPLDSTVEWQPIEWVDITEKEWQATPAAIESNLGFWEALHRFIDREPPLDSYRHYYGELAALGIVKGRPFAPDDRMKGILEQAARLANAQMRVQSFADRRPDRIVWPGTHWEWAVLRPETGTFDTDSYVDLEAREKWFFQAMVESPAMFRRSPGAGSLYWLGTRDSTGAFLDGSHSYTLSVPQPVPNKLFWSITVYDAETRSEVATDQNLAALRSLFELADVPTDQPVTLYFGPEPPVGESSQRWIKTKPGVGWFVYFRIYGPDEAAFDGTWQLPDFQRTD